MNVRLSKVIIDTRKVLEAAKKGMAVGLKRWGAFVRSTARRSIRRSKKSAEPGKPPKSHEGTLKRLIFFGLENDHRAVVAGPIAAKSEIAALLETGGTKDGVDYEAFPYMKPAGDIANDRLDTFFENVIR